MEDRELVLRVLRRRRDTLQEVLEHPIDDEPTRLEFALLNAEIARRCADIPEQPAGEVAAELARRMGEEPELREMAIDILIEGELPLDLDSRDEYNIIRNGHMGYAEMTDLSLANELFWLNEDSTAQDIVDMLYRA